MKNPFQNIDGAFTCLEETLTWISDKAPHISSTFNGVVLQGAMENQNTGVLAAPLFADQWTVRVPAASLLVSKISVGDVIQRGCWKTAVLNVQQTYQDASGDFWLLCVAEQRAPLG